MLFIMAATVGKNGARVMALSQWGRFLPVLIVSLSVADVLVVTAASAETPAISTLSADALRRAANAGVTNAMIELGDRYAAGAGVPQSDQIAREFYRRAAKAGDTVGNSRLRGEGPVTATMPHAVEARAVGQPPGVDGGSPASPPAPPAERASSPTPLAPVERGSPSLPAHVAGAEKSQGAETASIPLPEGPRTLPASAPQPEPPPAPSSAAAGAAGVPASPSAGLAAQSAQAPMTGAETPAGSPGASGAEFVHAAVAGGRSVGAITGSVAPPAESVRQAGSANSPNVAAEGTKLSDALTQWGLAEVARGREKWVVVYSSPDYQLGATSTYDPDFRKAVDDILAGFRNANVALWPHFHLNHVLIVDGNRDPGQPG